MSKVYVVVEDNATAGIGTVVFNSKSEAKKQYKEIVNHYKEVIGTLGNGEINDYYAEMTNEWDEEIGRVFWQENYIK